MEVSGAGDSVQPQSLTGSTVVVPQKTKSVYPKREQVCGQPTVAKLVRNAEELTLGDHILYQVTQFPHRQMYYSALVINIDTKNAQYNTMEVVTNNANDHGVSEKKFVFDELHNLHTVVYSHQYEAQESIQRARTRIDENHYHPLRNNSHHFVTWCKTGQEYPLTDHRPMLKDLESAGNQHEKGKLNFVVTKTLAASIADIKSGNHVMLKKVHYLVKCVNYQNNTFSAYSVCERKMIILHKQIKWKELEILKCSQHLDSTNGDEALRRAEDEMGKAIKRKWGSGDYFVTAMLCGVEHSMHKQYMIADDAAPIGYTLVTPIVTIRKGDHLVFNEFSNKLRSVIVQEYVSDTKVIVKPPLSEGEIIDLTAHPEVYLVDYCECLQGPNKLSNCVSPFAHKTAKIHVNSPIIHNSKCNCLPADEVIKRVNSPAGETVFEKNVHDHSRFITWAKIGREVSIETTQASGLHSCKFSYIKIESTDKLKPADHLVEYCRGKRRHLMVTEREPTQSSFKVILCQHNLIQEQSQIFDLSSDIELYRVQYMYVDESSTHESTMSLYNKLEPNLSIMRGRSYLNQQLYNPWAYMLFIMWAKTGIKEDSEQVSRKKSRVISFNQLFCMWAKTKTKEGFELNTCSQPVSRNRIVSFKQLTPGDYLLVRPLVGCSHHYLITSVHSPSRCFAIEYHDNQTVTSEELKQLQPDKFPLYYRVNYEPGACIPNETVVKECQRLIGYTLPDGIDYQNFVHYLKTQQELKVSVDDLQISCEIQHANSPNRVPQFIQTVPSLDALILGDHIIYRESKPPFRPIYQSALVLCAPQNEQVEIATMTCDGIVKITRSFKALPNLHQLVYHSCHFSAEEVIKRVNEFKGNQEHHHYHERYNNCHHFATHCKSDQENPLTEILKELEIQDQGYEQTMLKPVLRKVPLNSIQDIKKGDHLEIKTQHYLVQSVDHELEQLSAFTTTIHKCINRVTMEKRNIEQTKDSIFLIEYDCYSAVSDVEMSLDMVRVEMSMNSKWQRSDLFVTEMKCGTAHLVDDRCYIKHNVDIMVGVTKVTPHTSVDIGDHLIIKENGKFYSVLVCNIVNQTGVAVIPPIQPSHSLHELAVIQLTACSEVYRINYNHSLPPQEAIERAQSYAGEAILQKLENSGDYGPFVTWAKTGREVPVPVQELISMEQIEISHPFQYKRVLSPDELKVGQHIFRYGCLNSYREHLLITEQTDSQTKFKVIQCLRTRIKEVEIELDPSQMGKDIYQIIYQDELPTETTIKRARSLIGQHKFDPRARMWFVPWAKTGSNVGVEVDLMRNLTRPVSKSRIVCFTQLNKGDYLVEEKNHYFGKYHHYLIESIESPEKCTVIESWEGWIERKQLNLVNASTSDDHPWFYRINYEGGICISVEESIAEAQKLIKKQKWPLLRDSEYRRRSCIHFLKTGESADIDVNKLLDDRTLLQRESIMSAMELKPGDHIERPMSFASSYAQHHMYVVEPVDDKHCTVIHYKVSPMFKPNSDVAKFRKGKVTMETVNIFDQTVCYRVCYSERIDPEIGLAKLMELCGQEEYDVIGNNCEHLVMIATLGIPLSIQVDKFIYHALRTGKAVSRSVRTSCLHHGIHVTPESTAHGAYYHALQTGVNRASENAKCLATMPKACHGFKVGIKAAATGSALGPVAGIAIAVNAVIEGPLLVRSIYKLSQQKTFSKLSELEYKRRRDTKIITTVNSILGGTLGAVAGHAVLWQVPIIGAAVGGVIGNIAGQSCGQLEAKLYCSLIYPDLPEITLPEIEVKQYLNLSALIIES